MPDRRKANLKTIFVYEYVTAGGWREEGDAPADSLLAEGRAMVAAVAADFMAIDGVRVVTMTDVDANEWQTFERLAAEADGTLVIAPETAGVLERRSRLVIEAGGRLLSPSPATIAMAADKQRAAERLERHGVPVPRGMAIRANVRPVNVPLSFPAVLKPIDGCGSHDVRMIHSAREVPWESIDRPLRLEAFVPGLAASVAILCGPAGLYPLPACEQILSGDGRFAYLGGRLPLAADLDARARRLALAAVRALPEPQGYIGVDLVLGKDSDGSGDRVIEINPRLTTSYVGLRALSRSNLAAAMLEVLDGVTPVLSFHQSQVEFTADGRCTLARSASEGTGRGPASTTPPLKLLNP